MCGVFKLHVFALNAVQNKSTSLNKPNSSWRCQAPPPDSAMNPYRWAEAKRGR